MKGLISRQAASGCEYWDSESNFCSLHRPSAERHGRWIYLSGLDAFECSVCGRQMVRNIFNYCPWCGASMDEVEDEK